MKTKGFTIIESLVAISILATVVIGTMSAVQSSLSSSIFSKEQIVAFYLAQEAIEQIRNLRDENRLNGRDWLTGLAANSSDPCYFGNSCMVSPVFNTAPTRCSGPGACPLLRQNVADSFYGYISTWNQTNYRRDISLTSISAQEVSLVVTVSWSKGLVNREFKARENLLNW